MLRPKLHLSDLRGSADVNAQVTPMESSGGVSVVLLS